MSSTADPANNLSGESNKSRYWRPLRQCVLRPKSRTYNASFESLSQKAEAVYDITFRFAHKVLGRGDRTVDQMIQSARSGKQNILEGSKAATTSKETEIKLTNVGRASLEELLADYRDYLRVRDLRIWKDSSV